MQNDDNSKKIKGYLKEKNVPEYLNGFVYLFEGIKFFMEEDSVLHRNKVYDAIANKYQINKASVISSINYALLKSDMNKIPIINLLIFSASEISES